jgi:hypothetical protein
MLQLFVSLLKGEIFYFYDKPERRLVKIDHSRFLSPEGPKRISPTVAVFTVKPKRIKSFYDQTEGENDDTP